MLMDNEDDDGDNLWITRVDGDDDYRSFIMDVDG